MSHFAKVVNGIVTELIVAEQTFVDTLEGLWIQTSYNTSGGVHYNSSGEPDGPGFRKNYAAVGGHYDADADAFHDKRPPGRYNYLNKDTYRWTPVLENKTQDPKVNHRGVVPTKVYITNKGRAQLGQDSMDNLSRSLDLEFISDPKDATIALPVDDFQVIDLVSNPELSHLAPMSAEAYATVADRMCHPRLGMLTLPSILPLSAEDLLELDPEGPVFVKRQRTCGKDTSPWAYTYWDTPTNLLESITPEFWAEQANPLDSGGAFVVQPALQHPFKDLSINISVNAGHEMLVMSVMSMTHDSINKLGRYVPFEGEGIEKLLEALRNVCIDLKLGAGIHELQLVEYLGDWALMDWNPRMTGALAKGYPTSYPVLDDAILHMLGRPLRHAADHLYTEQRSYRNVDLTAFDAVYVALSCGLYPRYDAGATAVCRLAGIGESVELVQERFAAFETACSLYNK